MGLFFIHIIKSSLCLIAFYLSYKAFLSKETFYKANRFILLTIIVASVLLPFFRITIREPVVATVSGHLTGIEHLLLKKEITLNSFPANTGDSFYFLLFLVYVLGALTQLIITIVNFVKIYRLVYQAEHFTYGNYKLAVTRHEQSAFSWGKYIVLSENDYNNNPEIIIRHELVHLNRCHFYDLLLAELAIVIFWFNPVIWLLKAELKNIHEFEVDDTLLQQGIDAKEYQLLLIKKAVGAKNYAIVNTFSQSKLRIRIRMMLRQKSNPWAGLKYLSLIVLTLTSIIAFARPEVVNKLQRISSGNLSGFINKQVSTLSERLGNGQHNDDQAVNASKGESQPVKSKPGGILDNSTGDNSTVVDTREKKNPLCIVNDKETSYREFQKINSQLIKTVQVLKEKDGIAAYGEKGKNGVIIVNLIAEKPRYAKAYYEGMPIDTAALVVFFINGNPLSDAEQALFNNQLGSFSDADLVERVVPLKGKAASDKYGQKGSKGVVEIYLKNK